MGETARLGLPFPGLDVGADGPAAFQALAEALDGAALADQGVLASRPVSTPASPGIIGRFYRTTDQIPNLIWFDYGTGWIALGLASRLISSNIVTSNVTVSSAGTPGQEIISLGAQQYNGEAVRIDLEALGVYMPSSGESSLSHLRFFLVDGATLGPSIGYIEGPADSPGITIPLHISHILIPSAGEHTFSIYANSDTVAKAVIYAGTGATGTPIKDKQLRMSAYYL